MTLREVARSTGLSTGTVTYHFGTRRGLLLEAVTYGYWHMPSWPANHDPVEAMRYVFRRYVLSTGQRRVWWQFWLAVTSHAQGDEELGEWLAEQHRSVVGRWAGCLERGVRQGVFRPEIDPQAEASRLAAYAHGLAVSQPIDRSQTAWAGTELTRELDQLRVGTPKADTHVGAPITTLDA
jgi:AcrR family transcriptional regulator